MNIFLRFGMHKDIEVIHSAASQLDGLVIPGHILAYQHTSTSVFVCSLPEHDYFIDPMTFMLQNTREKLLGDDGELRKSVSKWCNYLHPDLKTTIEGGDVYQPCAVGEIPDIRDLCVNSKNFQLSVVSAGHSDKKASKYIERYASTLATSPRSVVPPYFMFNDVNDPWYGVSRNAASITLDLGNDPPVHPILHFAPESLGEDTIGAIANDYRMFGKVILWPNDLNQNSVSVDNIKQVRELVQSLNRVNVSSEALYGGFLLMLMGYDGLEMISHGSLYTEHKSSTMLPGSGGVPERYYIPKFHAFRSLGQANLILRRHPELMCTCSVCSETFNGDPDRIVAFEDNPELLRQHFFLVRRQEADSIVGIDKSSQMDDLNTTYELYHDSICALPNPDAVLTDADMKGLGYLIRWVEGLA